MFIILKMQLEPDIYRHFRKKTFFFTVKHQIRVTFFVNIFFVFVKCPNRERYLLWVFYYFHQSQKHTCTSQYLVELLSNCFTSAKRFRFPSTNFLNSFLESGLTERQNWCNWVGFVGLLAVTHLFSAAHKSSVGLRSGLCDGHSYTLTLLSLKHFVTNLEVCLGSLSIRKTSLHPRFNVVADVFRCCLSVYCLRDLFCEMHQSLLQQNSSTT